MTAFINHFAFEFRSGIRNKQLLIVNYMLPLGFYFMMGAIMPQINPLYSEIMTPSMVSFAILATTMLGLPPAIVEPREAGIYRSYKINGIPAASILAIPALTTLMHLTISAIVITATGPLLFDAGLPESWGNYLLVFAAGAIACAGLGALIGVISPNAQVTVMFGQLFFVPSMLLGGLMMPLSILPEAVARFARILPAAHMMNGFNALSMGAAADFDPSGSVIALFAGGVIAFGLALYLFNWDRRNTASRGHPLLALLALAPYLLTLL